MFSIEQLTAKDLQTYRDELLRYKEFNVLNENLIEFYSRSSLFNKIQYRSGARIIKFEDRPIMIIWSETRNYNVKVRSIIPIGDVELLDGHKITGIMELFRESLPQHLDIHQFEYLVLQNDLNRSILNEMGFKMRQGILKMILHMNEAKIPYEKALIKKFGIEDIKARVDIQNQIFDNKYRMPINTTDILIEVSKKSYIPELSFFYVYGGKYIGYGQINTNNSQYFLVNFGLIPEYRGKGLSKPFLLTILAKAKEYGIEKLLLEVNDDNISAVNLYHSVGFTDDESTCTWIFYSR
jgi:ribosomal protein S18 acetylase RimI-like enzyme